MAKRGGDGVRGLQYWEAQKRGGRRLVSYLSCHFSLHAAFHLSPHSNLPFDLLLLVEPPVFFRMCVSADLNAHDTIIECLKIERERAVVE